jgi:hypothetical protein
MRYAYTVQSKQIRTILGICSTSIFEAASKVASVLARAERKRRCELRLVDGDYGRDSESSSRNESLTDSPTKCPSN